MADLHIFAVNADLEGRHTYLSRSRGETMALPDLASWLGLDQGGLNLDEIELFPAEDLAGMALSDYVTTAFDLEAAPEAQLSARMNALEGHVLLIPGAVLAGEVQTGPELTLIARLPMARPDHSSDALEPLPHSTPAPTPSEPEPEEEGMSPTKRRLLAVLTAFILAALIVFGREFM
ncbi:MAG: hypothetical protein OXC60_12845 [Litoreibacter sp.]|nr:hypothetical protein [Litoreibacter sp.]MCY4335542.1 hypothetical protein [Litoreibacter sp.]